MLPGTDSYNMSSTSTPNQNATGDPSDPDHLHTTVIPWILASLWILVWIGLILLGVFFYLYRRSQIEKIIAKRKSKKLQVESIIDSARKVKHSESENSMRSVDSHNAVKIPELNSEEKAHETSMSESNNNNAVYVADIVVDSPSEDVALDAALPEYNVAILMDSHPEDGNLDLRFPKPDIEGKLNGGYQIDTIGSNMNEISNC